MRSSICELSDDLLVKILTLIENTKDVVVGTSLVSKRWRSLWKLVPRLDASGSDFINNFLLLSKAPVLETLHLRLRIDDENTSISEHLERWVGIAVARQVRDLELLYYRSHHLSNSVPPCPRSLFTCKGLVVLRLQEVVILDIPWTIFLQTLKTLSLVCVRFVSGDELVHRLLSACPILETLTIRRLSEDYVTTFTIAIPSLQSLYIMERPDSYGLDCEYVVNAPSLKTLKVFDKFGQFRSLVKMPKLVKAEIKIRHEDSQKLMGCLTSAKHLSLCLNSPPSPPLAKSCESLCQLEYLELCTNCSSDWLCLVLRHSPKLRVLKLSQKNCGMFGEYMPQLHFEAQKVQWDCVPECLVSSLESVEWIGYRGTEAEIEAAVYIIDKSKHLKKMTLYRKIANLREKYRTLIDLASRMTCASSTCRLEFVPL